MKANILLVEDNWIAAEVVRTVLERRGHAVMLATTGRQAMEWMSYQSYDLILYARQSRFNYVLVIAMRLRDFLSSSSLDPLTKRDRLI